MRNATQKEIDKFIQYRANHVALVQRIGKVVFNTNLSDHDKDKIEANGDKLNLFALRNSMLNGTYHPYNLDKKKLNNLVGEHVKSQKHHPEYWDDTITVRNFDDSNPPQVNAHKMPKRYLLEMCCDWSAVAIRLNKPIFSWYNKTCVGENARFLFTDNQKEYIIECLSIIQSKIDSEKLYYPNVTYNAEQVSPKIDFGKKLTESQIDSDNFQKWFGDSVVKDNNGNPLILYHGTPSTTPNITEFDSSKASNNYGEDTLIYATNSKEMAEVFSRDTTEGSLNFTKKLTGNKGKVYPLYMRLEHPMDFRNLTDRDIEALTQAYIEYKKDLGESKDNIEDIKNKYKEEIKKDFEFGVDFVKDRYLSYLVHPKYIHIFKEYGYDGIICPMREQEGINDALEYAVISPNQIKSIDNQGTFSLQSNNIYEKVITSFGGKVPISNKDKDQILKFCKKAVEDGMKPTKYTEEEMANSSNFSSRSIASNTPENNLKVINLGSEELTGLNEAFIICSMDGYPVAGTYTTDLNKAREMRKELADKYQVFFQLKKVQDKETKINESSSKDKTCVFTFGRYQPPTKGHLKVWKTLANIEADAHYIYTSHTKDKKKNPLSYTMKVNTINLALKEHEINAEVVESEAKTIIDVVVDIANKGFTDIIFVGGSDRLDDMVSLIKKYDNVPNKEGKSYHFNTIKGVSSGQRDPDSDSIEGVSGTKLRQFALDEDFDSFQRNLAFSDKHIAREVMDTIRANIN